MAVPLMRISSFASISSRRLALALLTAKSMPLMRRDTFASGTRANEWRRAGLMVPRISSLLFFGSGSSLAHSSVPVGQGFSVRRFPIPNGVSTSSGICRNK